MKKILSFSKEELTLIRLALLSAEDYNKMDEVKKCKLTMVFNDQLKELKQKFGFPTK
jgi:hypothetical protein